MLLRIGFGTTQFMWMRCTHYAIRVCAIIETIVSIIIRVLVLCFLRRLRERNNTIANNNNNVDSKIDQFVTTFLDDLHRDIFDMLTDTRTVENGYRGLDSARDTEAEVATMLRFFPTQLLSQQRHWHSLYPVQCLPAFMWCNNDTYLSNLKTAPFLHIFSAIAIECDKFEENQRGGFLVEDTFGQSKLRIL